LNDTRKTWLAIGGLGLLAVFKIIDAINDRTIDVAHLRIDSPPVIMFVSIVAVGLLLMSRNKKRNL
jgi:hypothetical protein